MFGKGIGYLILMQTYAKPFAQDPEALGVPLRLNAIEVPGTMILQDPVWREVYQQIIKDLDAAEQNLPENYSSAAFNNSKAHKVLRFPKTGVFTNEEYGLLALEASKIVSQNAPYIHQKEV
ncbi:MAG: RagB/SusD family nutrient uptake outer membrane protein [Saprospiraceae bacterium]|nr:RagB/SusD family nutrient uptake outer membrane protein [Saprospiraceae bacterium]